MRQQRLQETSTRFAFGSKRVSAYSHPGLDKRPNQPRPHGALMICAVPFAHAALVMCGVARLARRQRAQAERRPELVFHRFNNQPRPLTLEQSHRQTADGENLVWPERCVHSACLMIHIDEVVETRLIMIPKLF